MLTGKTVLLGVSAGVAAYKAVELCSRLVRGGAAVHVLMTPGAARLVAPLTFQAISGRAVHTEILGNQQFGTVGAVHIDHVALARAANLLVIAPATANCLARLAAGMGDDHVTVAALGVTCPVLIVPAMEEHMWRHPFTQRNAEILRGAGYHLMIPNTGRLASGLIGQGRLPEPAEIEQKILELVLPPSDLKGRRILVTAGATREPLDPVRFLTNHSTGKMGFAVAACAAARGAEVVLVTGPSALPHPPGVTVVPVVTALEMHAACLARADWYDAAVAAAAVSDYRPAACHKQKIKKGDGPLILELTRNPDIIAQLGATKKPNQITVGFAAETERMRAHAADKLANKNLDLVIANDVTEAGAGFAADTNRVLVMDRAGRSENLPLMTKTAVANHILDRIAELLSGLAQ